MLSFMLSNDLESILFQWKFHNHLSDADVATVCDVLQDALR